MKKFLSKQPFTRKNWNDRFFRYRFITFSLLIVGTIFCIVHIWGGSSIKYSFESNQGKANALSAAYLSLFNYIGTFFFLPILIKLLGFENNDKKFVLVQTIIVRLAVLNNLPFFFLMHFLSLGNYVTLKQFILILLAQSLINAAILAFLCIYIINKLIKDIRFLEKSSIQNHRPKTQTNKLHTFLIKLKISRLGGTLHLLVSFFLVLPFIVDIFQNDIVLYYMIFIYVGIVPLSACPLLFHFSVYILPGSEQCFTANIAATALSSKAKDIFTE
eukprot:snap_masked-scaffold_16-processed-gene-6.57-mRNA-1 protein AED:1.00 eAED:1.00 QI:0/0/0/0/1/1/2/0/272